MKTLLSILTLVLTATLVSGCEQRYRYPCQDPDNWRLESCQRPLCEVNRDCPEYIFEGNNKIQLPSSQPEKNGVNK